MRNSIHTWFIAAIAVGALFAPASAWAQSTAGPDLLFSPGASLDIVHRYNYSVRIDGRYRGHVQREDRLSLIERSSGPGDERRYAGELWQSTNTVRNMATVASRVDRTGGVRMEWDRGRLLQSAGEPTWQGLPTIPDAFERGEGAMWEAPAIIRVVLPDGSRTSVPTYAVYRNDGVERYEGSEVIRVTVGYRIVWPQTSTDVALHPLGRDLDPAELPPPSVTIRANRQGYLLMPTVPGVPVLQRTEVNDQFSGSTGVEVRSGFILTWYTGPPPPANRVARADGAEDGTSQRGDLTPVEVPLDGNRPAELEDPPEIADIEVDRDELDRLRLSIRNLQFIADRAQLLPGEEGRLDAVAEYLSSVPETTVLVTGHTADVGTASSQLELSVERAETIVEAMIARGVRPGRFRYEGRGGTEPVGDNATAEGRAANRRVEIRLIQ